MSTFASWTSVPVRSLLDQPPGAIPHSRSASISRQGVTLALGQATNSRANKRGRARRPAHAPIRAYQARRGAGVPQSLGTIPLLIMAALVRRVPDPRHSLDELHPPAFTILSTCLGRCRRARDSDVFGYDFSRIARLLGIILLIGIVKKKRHHDGRFRDSAEARRGICPRSNRSERPRCCGFANHDFCRRWQRCWRRCAVCWAPAPARKSPQPPVTRWSAG